MPFDPKYEFNITNTSQMDFKDKVLNDKLSRKKLSQYSGINVVSSILSSK